MLIDVVTEVRTWIEGLDGGLMSLNCTVDDKAKTLEYVPVWSE